MYILIAGLIPGITFRVLSHILREISKALRQNSERKVGVGRYQTTHSNCSYQLPSNVYVDDVIRIII